MISLGVTNGTNGYVRALMMTLHFNQLTVLQTQATHLVASMCTFVKDNTARKQVRRL